ncbi:MAG: Rab family GTPase, partial [Candidatus Heimdallarchaeota archaeon]
MAKLIFKIVIIGDPAVGKTSIRRNYLGETTVKEYIYTIGADFATKKLKISKNLSVQYQIFDLAGQQKFDKVRASFYSGVQAAILVYDITDNNTLRNIPKWIRETKKNNDGTLETFVLVGNKIDLKDQKKSNDVLLHKIQQELSKEMGHSILHITTSALTGENIDSLFKKLTYELLIAYSKDSP